MSVALPPGYIERFPSRGPWFDPANPPETDATVSILLPDGATDHATWTGKLWWGRREVHPVGWRKTGNFGASYAPKRSGS